MAERVSVKVQVDNMVNAIEEIRLAVSKYGKNILGDIGAAARLKIYPKYLSKPYRMKTGEIKQHDLMNPKWALKRGKPFTWSPTRGRLDSKGRQGMGYSFEYKTPSRNVAWFSSFMMNSYENDVYFHKGPRAGQLMRKGTHLFRDDFPDVIRQTIPHAVDNFNAKLAAKIAEVGLK